MNKLIYATVIFFICAQNKTKAQDLYSWSTISDSVMGVTIWGERMDRIVHHIYGKEFMSCKCPESIIKDFEYKFEKINTDKSTIYTRQYICSCDSLVRFMRVNFMKPETYPISSHDSTMISRYFHNPFYKTYDIPYYVFCSVSVIENKCIINKIEGSYR